MLQLKIAYGFRSPNQSATLVGDADRLEDLVTFLEAEAVPYHLSDECQTKYSDILEQRARFQAFVRTARDYKNAELDNEDYQTHVGFLRTQIKRNLRDHQKKAFYHLSKVGNGANFSVPGSGKTTVVLSAYEKKRIEGVVNLLFVVGPPSCFGPWQREFADVLGRSPSTLILAGGDANSRKQLYYDREGTKELYLTTFQTLLRDSHEVKAMLQRPEIRGFLVIDEAHYIKQMGGSWASAVLSIAPHATYRCILTGTPIPKSYSDLANLFEFLWPKHTVVTEDEKARVRAFETSNDIDAASSILEPVVGPLFYRVRKQELGLKAQIFYPPVEIEMNPYEKRLYTAVLGNIRHYDSMDSFLQDSVNATVTQAATWSNDEASPNSFLRKLLTTAVDNYQEQILRNEPELEDMIYQYDALEVPAKLEYLMTLVRSFQDRKEKVVIWANFIGAIELIRASILAAGFKCKVIYGDTPVASSSFSEENTREAIRDEFVDPDSGLDILIANPAACAESISHKTCFSAVYYNLSYNCAQYLSPGSDSQGRWVGRAGSALLLLTVCQHGRISDPIEP
ncbi:MAG: DEAD/DEAH box helicase [Flavobacteriales bacterium]|nr:DEAD/DEAH box helicase [Flavobacteriales bacterium]